MSRQMLAPLPEFGSFVRDRRMELGLKQISLAAELGVSRAYLCLIELGDKTCQPESEFLKELAQKLQTDHGALSSLIKKKPRKKKTISQRGHEKSLNARSPIFVERVRLQMSQVELSHKSNVSVSTISKMERGLHVPSPKTLLRLSLALGINTSPPCAS